MIFGEGQEPFEQFSIGVGEDRCAFSPQASSSLTQPVGQRGSLMRMAFENFEVFHQSKKCIE